MDTSSSICYSQNIEDQGIVSPLSDKSTESNFNFVFQPNQLVWAKVSGFRFWPGLIVDTETNISVPELLKIPYKEGWVLVHFFGTYDFAWVAPKSCIVLFSEGLKKGLPAKCKGKAFKIAVAESKMYANEGVKPEGFDVIPEILESGSDSERPITPPSEPIPAPLSNSVDTYSSDLRSPDIRDICNPNKKKKLELPHTQDKAAESSHSVSKSASLSDSRVRCVSAMRKLGLMPPEEYLGRKLPKKVTS